MGLNKDQYDFVNYVEQTYLSQGAIPSRAVAARQFGVSEDQVKRFYTNENVIAALKERGINLATKRDGIFSAEQVAYVNAILDPADTRSRRKLLADLGIKSTTVQSWNADPAFQTYLRDRAEAILPNAVSEAHIALVDNVMRGDMNAIKLVYEMSGRWSSKTVGELNVDFLMQKILEILTSELSDNPVVLTRIADKLGNLAGGPVPVGASPNLRVLEI